MQIQVYQCPENLDIYYLSDRQINCQNILQIDDLVTGYLITKQTNNHALFITWIYVQPFHRGKKIAIKLIHYLSQVARLKNITLIQLDDMSDHHWQSNNNLYLKCGFKYQNQYPEPEMSGHVDQIYQTTLNYVSS